jgi:hypothetical protein
VEGVFDNGQNNAIDSKNPTSIIQTFWYNVVPAIRGGVASAGGNISKTVNDTKNVINPDFQTQVENAQEADVGLTIDKIEGVSQQIFTHNSITLFSSIHGKTLDHIIPVNLSCVAYANTDKKNPFAKGIVKNNEVEITSIQSRPFICEFPAGTLKKGSYTIEFNAEFPFVTSSYITRYLIDNDRSLALQSQGIDVFKQYGIEDTNPVSIFTPGPIKIGVSTLDPLIALENNKASDVYLRMKIEPNSGWDGELLDINTFTFFLPKGFEVAREGTDFNCDPSGISVEQVQEYTCNGKYCINDVDNFNIITVIFQYPFELIVSLVKCYTLCMNSKYKC